MAQNIDNINSKLLLLLLLASDKQNILKFIIKTRPSNSDQHINITCDGCSKKQFTGPRFKCFKCSDYDLCLTCFKAQKQSKQHKKNHPMLAFRVPLQPDQNKEMQSLCKNSYNLQKTLLDLDLVHEGASCNYCNQNPIKGLKFKCQQCPQYQLCYQCHLNQKKSQQHQIDHRMIVIVTQLKQFSQDQIQIIETSSNSGFFGKVVKAKLKKNGKVVALKSIKAEKISQTQTTSVYTNTGSLKKLTWQNQRRCYSQFFSEYIINSYGYWSKRSINDTQLYIILEWMQSTLQKQVKQGQQSIRRLFQYIYQIALGLQQMHQKKFIHKDIKPDNILINKQKHAKLGDLGITLNMQNQVYGISKLCHRQFGAPQAFTKLYNCTSKIDMYPYGLTLNFVFTGTYHQRSSNKVKFQKLTPYFPQLMYGCIQQNPQKRLSSTQVVNILNAFDKAFWNTLTAVMPMNKYINLDKANKDKIFDSIYNKIWSNTWSSFKKS